MRVISLGWGVQSTTLAVMAALGDIDPVDVIIHADTTHERAATYEYAAYLTPWLEERGVRVVTVKADETGVINRKGGVMIPAYIEDGGVFDRQCTSDWKVAPIRRWLQTNRNKGPVDMLLGISLDEYRRIKPSGVKYITNHYPLIDKRMTRQDCRMYLARAGVRTPPRSACVFCPFQSKNEWRSLAIEDYAKALMIDHKIRKARPPRDLFVCVQRKPLNECDLLSDEDKGQLSLWENECEGLCGV